MTRFLKIILPTIFLLLVGIVIFMYWNSFGNRLLSEDSAQWGQFGDYIGGLLNPIIGLANLLLIAYFGYYGFIKDKENLKKQMMPLVHIEFEQEYNTIGGLERMGIKLKNCGFGPMIVTNITIIGPDNSTHGSYNEILDKFPQSVRAWTYHNGEEGVIDKGEVRYLMEVKSIEKEHLKKEGYDYLKQFGLQITYKDIFDDEHLIEKSAEILFDGAKYYGKN